MGKKAGIEIKKSLRGGGDCQIGLEGTAVNVSVNGCGLLIE